MVQVPTRRRSFTNIIFASSHHHRSAALKKDFDDFDDDEKNKRLLLLPEERRKEKRTTTTRGGGGKTLFEGGGNKKIESAYVHLPFCAQKCHYCDFATQVVGPNTQQWKKKRGGGAIEDAMEEYADAVCREIAHQGRLRGTYEKTRSRTNADGGALETIFFGGGTPSLMPVKQLEKVMTALERAFGIDWSRVEISMECDPGTFTRETLRGFVGLGVNRVSLGAQSFDERVLKACGRTHGVLEIYESVEHVHALLGSGRSSSNSKHSGSKTNSIETWSMDLISGLPGSTLEIWEKGLHETLECEAPHVSTYDLQVEEKTAFGKWYGDDDESHKLGDRLPLPSESVVAEQYKLASEILTTRGGFHRYEISSFAKGVEHECKHNKNYWDAINGSWYAFGLSATSRIDNERLARPRGMKQYYGFVQDFEQNSFGVEEAFSQLRKDCTDEEVLDEIADAILERIMLGFRTARGVDVKELERSFGKKVVEELFDALRFVEVSAEQASEENTKKRGEAKKLYEIIPDDDKDRGKIKAVRLTDPDGFLVSTEIISSVISRMPSLKNI